LSLSRRIILSAADNVLIRSIAVRYGLRLGASRFVAGTTIEDALRVARELNSKGLVVTMDLLGESVSNRDEALAAREEILKILPAVEREGIDSGLSIKLTQLGLDIDGEFCLDNVDRIVRQAKELGNFVRIDMEDSPRVQATIDIFRELHDRYGDHVGLAVQSYLYRTMDDVIELGPRKANLRIVKGAYSEPPEVAYQSKRDVDEEFCRIVEKHLELGGYAAVATHDRKIIDFTKRLVQERGIPHDQFEFQMLYGISRGLQEELVSEGYKVRVYLPFGSHWYPYFTRRLAERPANLFFVLRNLLRY